ncbi:DinB family protein [Pedobacter metabolipauper]|uniref:DinB family protein n=1 Tax=Pedobacter metabolipauper TaxID=425513 RepID=A0A4R6SYS2_9SPHI|nr:DinB family protein [Pedobacter metabolipauper]TDQ09852.1 DinB family protein [Pedobacter metabolipauper]
MGIARDFKHIVEVVTDYKERLNTINDAVFELSPPTGGWSFSEVYFHILDASVLTLDEIKVCTNGNGKRKDTAFIVKLILFLGSLPPGKKYEAPNNLAERLKKINKTEAMELADHFLFLLTEEYPNIRHADQGVKTRHPTMGYLNAAQWLRFMRIHLEHHVKQLDRIKESLK